MEICENHCLSLTSRLSALFYIVVLQPEGTFFDICIHIYLDIPLVLGTFCTRMSFICLLILYHIMPSLTNRHFTQSKSLQFLQFLKNSSCRTFSLIYIIYMSVRPSDVTLFIKTSNILSTLNVVMFCFSLLNKNLSS